MYDQVLSDCKERMFPNERTRIIRQTDRPIHQIRQTGKEEST